MDILIIVRIRCRVETQRIYDTRLVEIKNAVGYDRKPIIAFVEKPNGVKNAPIAVNGEVSFTKGQIVEFINKEIGTGCYTLKVEISPKNKGVEISVSIHPSQLSVLINACRLLEEILTRRAL